jgi:hypothetical protein
MVAIRFYFALAGAAILVPCFLARFQAVQQPALARIELSLPDLARLELLVQLGQGSQDGFLLVRKVFLRRLVDLLADGCQTLDRRQENVVQEKHGSSFHRATANGYA